LNWVEEQDGPWAAFMNLMDAHYPYRPRDENKWGDQTLLKLQDDWRNSSVNNIDAFRDGDLPWWQLQAFESLYDGAIRSIDSLLERTIRTLEQRGELDNTQVIITADHGEGFGEQSEHNIKSRIAGHGPQGGGHEAKTHVPLICYSPDQDGGQFVSRLSSLVHLPEYIMSVINDGGDPFEFCTDQAIVSFDQGFDKRFFVVYEQSDNIRKHAVYSDSLYSTTVSDNVDSSSMKRSEKIIQEVESSLENADISRPRDEALQSSTENRLRNLGYID
jgi:arylsulfatase